MGLPDGMLAGVEKRAHGCIQGQHTAISREPAAGLGRGVAAGVTAVRQIHNTRPCCAPEMEVVRGDRINPSLARDLLLSFLLPPPPPQGT